MGFNLALELSLWGQVEAGEDSIHKDMLPLESYGMCSTITRRNRVWEARWIVSTTGPQVVVIPDYTCTLYLDREPQHR